MSNNFYNPSGRPGDGTACLSAELRAEFSSISDAFGKAPAMFGNGFALVRINNNAMQHIGCPSLSGNGGKILRLNSAETGFEFCGEHETWTPELITASGFRSISYTSRSGRYMRLGNRVFFSCGVVVSASSAYIPGEAVLVSAPIAAAGSGRQLVNMFIANMLSAVAGTSYAGIDAGGTGFTLRQSRSSTSAIDSAFTSYYIGAGTEIYLSGSYEV